MLKRLFWPEAADILAGYSREPARKIARYSVLAMVAMVLVSLIPYFAGSSISSLVRMEEEQGIIDLEFVAATGTAIVLAITFWYVATSHVNRELRILALGMTKKMREDLNGKLMRFSVGTLDSMRAGDAASNLATDLPAIFDLLSADFSAFFTGNVMIALILIIMAVVSPPLALVYLVLVPAVLFVARRLTSMSKDDFAAKKESVDRMSSAMSEVIANHRTIKANNLEGTVMKSFVDYDLRFVESSVGAETRIGMISPIVRVAINLGYVAAVVLGAILMYRGSLDVGMFLAFMVYARLMDRPLAAASASQCRIESETLSLKRVLSVLDAPEPEQDAAEDGFEPEGRLEFRDVRFSYGDEEVLHGVSFTVEPGKVAVITGPTGSGKSTLMNILLRFYPVDSGSVRIDGRDIRSISRRDLGKAVAAVLQDPWVFEGTIRENIVYGREWAGQEDIGRALAITGFDSFVRSLPQGLDTPVGNDVNVMPLAQRRMLAMSRAVLGNPRILILDEAFSGLDPITETDVFAGLRRMMAGRTVLIVGHKRNLIDSADQVIRLESGRIASQTER